MNDVAGPVPVDRRVGVVVPPGNPVVEPELHALVTPTLFPYVARFPVHDDLDLAGRLVRYVEDTPCTAASLRDLPVAATYLACTGSSYSLGVDGNRAWIEAAAAATNAPVGTAASVVADVLRAASVERVRIVSPYPSWLTSRCVEFWTAQGVTVDAVDSVADDDSRGAHPIYRLGAGAVTAAIEHAIDVAGSGTGRSDAVLVAGTGAPTVGALDQLQAATDIVLVSSNVAAAWWLLTVSGHAPAIAASAHPSLAQLPVEVVR